MSRFPHLIGELREALEALAELAIAEGVVDGIELAPDLASPAADLLLARAISPRTAPREGPDGRAVL